MRKFAGDQLVIASHNKGKLREIAELLAPFGVKTVSAGELGLIEPAETEDSFAGNARIKAHFAAQASGLPALSDDSGIMVEPRTARFCCTLCLAWPDGHDELFEGKVEGRLVWPMRGSLGFGFDPIFLPEGQSETFGEMDPSRKHAMSHRADAFAKLIAGCFV